MNWSPAAAEPWIRLAAALAPAWRLQPPAQISRGLSGAQLLNQPGSSLDFHDYRPYLPGDDLRQVDWSVYARSDALVIRQYREEVSPVLEIWLDASASLGLYPGKCAAAVFSAALLMTLARQAEGRPVLLIADRRHVGNDCEPALRAESFGRAADFSDRPPGGGPGGRPVRVLVGDFLFPADFGARLAAWRRDAAGLILVQILAASELRPDLRGGVRLRDAENARETRELRITPAALARYQQRLKQHLDQLAQAVRRHGAALVRLDEPDEASLLEPTGRRLVDAFRQAGVIDAA